MAASKDFIRKAKALLNDLSIKFKRILIQRLKDDDRVASKDLINSVDHVIQEIFFGVQTEISWLFYGNFFETGIPASRIPFGGKTGKRTSKYIQGLVDWIMEKGLTSGLDKDPLSFAFAIAHKHKEKGWPLRGRINVMTDVINEFEPIMERTIEMETEDIIFVELDNVITEVTKSSKFITSE